MEYQANIKSEELNIQKLLSNFLNLRVSGENLPSDSLHLDEDALSAFVEGSLGHRESEPIVSHLVDCSFCRNVTSDLVKLEMSFGETETETVINAEVPSKISQVLSSVLSRIFGSNEGVVFAHQEKEEETEEETENADKK